MDKLHATAELVVAVAALVWLVLQLLALVVSWRAKRKPVQHTGPALLPDDRLHQLYEQARAEQLEHEAQHKHPYDVTARRKAIAQRVERMLHTGGHANPGDLHRRALPYSRKDK